MQNKMIIGLIVLAACLLTYFFGPKRIEYKEKIVEKIVEVKDKNRVTNTIKIETKKPDGTVSIETRTQEVESEKSTTASTKEVETSKKVDGLPTTTLTLMMLNPTSSKDFGAGISYRLLGPFSLGAMVLNKNGINGGITLGVSL